MNAAVLPASSNAESLDANSALEGLKTAPSFFELLMSQTLQQPQASPKGFRCSALLNETLGKGGSSLAVLAQVA